jgi:hypothetical protein
MKPAIVPRPDPWVALRLGAEAAQFLPLDPVAWVRLADLAGMEPTYVPPHGKQREGMMNKVADTDHDLREFLTGWLNTRPREELAGIVDLLRRRSEGGSRGKPLEVPPEVSRACGRQFYIDGFRDDGMVVISMPVSMYARLVGGTPEDWKRWTNLPLHRRRVRLSRRAER